MRYGSMVWLFDFLDFIMQLCYSFNWVIVHSYTYNFLIELLKKSSRFSCRNYINLFTLISRLTVTGDLVMKEMKFSKELYSKIALIKAAYNYTDIAYVHLDADDVYYYVSIENKKPGQEINEQDFINEMLAQSVRHEIYQQTKNIRELLLARAMATSVIVENGIEENEEVNGLFNENEILKDWFVANEESEY